MAASRRRLLVVDDSLDTRELLERNLSAQGYEVLTAADVPQAIAILGSEPIDLVITDLKMPGVSGLELVRHVREQQAPIDVIMVTGYPSVEGAIAALKSGAEEYLSKPFTQEELFAAVSRVLEKAEPRRLARAAAGPSDAPLGIVARSPAMRPVLDAIPRLAARSTPVLVLGERGTGRELVARAIHYTGPRALAPFLVFDCGAIPADLVESQLLGRVREGSGRPGPHPGFAQAAGDGTLFLKDVDRLPPAAQATLARGLDEGQFLPPGSTAAEPIRFRLIAASHRHLASLVDAHAFREDLFARLRTDVLELPSLGDRGDDVVALAGHLAARFAADLGRPVPQFADDALQAIEAYSWPGNVPELETAIQQVLAQTRAGVVGAGDLPATVRHGARAGRDLSRRLADVERDHLRRVLASVGGNKTKAAEILGISRKTLRDKLKQGEPVAATGGGG